MALRPAAGGAIAANAIWTHDSDLIRVAFVARGYTPPYDIRFRSLILFIGAIAGGRVIMSEHERVAFDFDNTITKEGVRYWAGERPDPDPEVVKQVREAYHSGHTVIIWTARPWSEANTIAAHLTEWEVPYHGIRCEKGSADRYIDDKAELPRGHEKES